MKRKLRWWMLLLLIPLFLIGLWGADRLHFYWNFLMHIPVTMEMIKHTTTVSMQSANYQEGKQALHDCEQGKRPIPSLTEPEKPGRFANTWSMVNLALRVDLLRSITPLQLQELNSKGGLPYSALTPDQQALIELDYKYGDPYYHKQVSKQHLPQSVFYTWGARYGRINFRHEVWRDGVVIYNGSGDM